MSRQGHGEEQPDRCERLLERASAPGEHDFLRLHVRPAFIWLAYGRMLDPRAAHQHLDREEAPHAGALHHAGL